MSMCVYASIALIKESMYLCICVSVYLDVCVCTYAHVVSVAPPHTTHVRALRASKSLDLRPSL